MDFTSIEFYTIAFCVAMGLVGFFLTQKRIKPATSRINALELESVAEEEDATSPGTLKFTGNTDGTVTISRTGIRLIEGETVNLIATIVDDKLTIEEKKGKASALGGKESLFRGSVTVDYIPADGKYYVRYDSSVTGQWCKFSFKNTSRNFVEREMRY
jgi:hypothetical protein